jgi:hypothetical protein
MRLAVDEVQVHIGIAQVGHERLGESPMIRNGFAPLTACSQVGHAKFAHAQSEATNPRADHIAARENGRGEDVPYGRGTRSRLMGPYSPVRSIVLSLKGNPGDHPMPTLRSGSRFAAAAATDVAVKVRRGRVGVPGSATKLATVHMPCRPVIINGHAASRFADKALARSIGGVP